MPTEIAAVKCARSYDRASSLFRSSLAARAVGDKAGAARDRSVGSSWEVRDPKSAHETRLILAADLTAVGSPHDVSSAPDERFAQPDVGETTIALATNLKPVDVPGSLW